MKTTATTLFIMSLPFTLASFFPLRVMEGLNDIAFIVGGWMLSIIITIIVNKSTYPKTPQERKNARLEMYWHMVIYTLIFLLFKLSHLWLIYDNSEYLAAVAYPIIITIYFMVCLGGLIDVGNNLEKKFKQKPKFFKTLDMLYDLAHRTIGKKLESTCKLEPIDENEEIKDTPNSTEG